MSSFEHGTGWVPLGPEVWLYRLDKTSSRAEFVSGRREAEARRRAQAPGTLVPAASVLVEAETPLTPEEEARGIAARQKAPSEKPNPWSARGTCWLAKAGGGEHWNVRREVREPSRTWGGGCRAVSSPKRP